jgi:GAF domain-containing protein
VPLTPPSAVIEWQPRTDDGAAERLRTRTRQLALANQLGARLAAMTDVDAIARAVVDELHEAFGFFLCAVVRVRDDGQVDSAAGRGEAFVQLGIQNWSQPVDHGLIGRCIRLREPVMSGDVYAEQGYEATPETVAVRSELVVPLLVDGEVWGVINCEELRADAFDADDVRLLQTVAAQAGAALHTARLYGRLERAVPGHGGGARRRAGGQGRLHGRPRSLDRRPRRGRRPPARDGRRGSARPAPRRRLPRHRQDRVPDWILNKPGPPTDDERAVMERHTIVGEQILAPVEFLAGVRPLVRHEHERWDGRGYPDGLAGEEIPLGARIIPACDALHAMTSDRPYRAALPHQVA